MIENIDELIKAHSTFSTVKLAQKCFVNKTKCNEYHGNGKGVIPLTLRDLNQQILRETITNLDQFKYQVKSMGDRLNNFIKPELVNEAKTLTKKLVKVANEAKPSAPAKPSIPAKPSAPAKAEVTKPSKPIAPRAPNVGGRRGRSGQAQQEESTESNKENKEALDEKDKDEVIVPKKTVDGRRGKRLKNTDTKESPDNEDLDKLSLELTQDIVPTQVTKENKKEPPRKGRGRGRGKGKENDTKVSEVGTVKIEEEETVKIEVANTVKEEESKISLPKDEKPLPNVKIESLPKPATTGGRGKRKAPEKTKEEDNASVDAKKVKGSEDKVVQNTLLEKSLTQNKKVSRRQNKKSNPAISAMPNNTKMAGVSLLGKGMPQLPTTPLPISLKKTMVGTVRPINMPTIQPGGKVVNIASLLPTSPNPRMHSPTQIRPGTQQLIQIRPGNVHLQSQGPSLTGSNLVQIRPPNSVLNAIGNTTLRPHQIQAGGIGSAGSIIGAPGGPQFFKIIGGKPVQLSGAASASLASSTSGKFTIPTISGPMTSTASGQGGPRIVYVRKGPGGNAIPVGGNGSSMPITSTPTTSSALTTSGSPSKLQNKIILVSNKNQLPGGKGQTLSTPQGVVKLVGGAPGSSQLAPGILSSLRPVAVSTSGGTTVSGSGPVLLRTVMPKPQASVFQKTIRPTPSIIGVVPQLPNVPIPKSKLNDKTTTTSSAGTRTKMSVASSATSVEQLLPKRPIPQQKVPIGGGTGPPPPKIFKRVISGPVTTTGNLILPSSGSLILPSNMIPSPPNTQQQLSLKQPQQQVTTISGPFVWKNSSQTNFKLSSRINFASFAKFKESQVAAEAAAAAASGSNKKGKKGKNNMESLANNEEIHFTLATIVTDDKSNEFTFRLNLKNDPKDPKGTSTFLELEARSKKPHNDHKWNLKVKTNPERYLVSGGCFKTDDSSIGKTKNTAKNVTNETCAFRIPKEISDLKFVDYELQIDKVLVLQQQQLQQQPSLTSNSPSKNSAAVIITSSANKVNTTKKIAAK